MPENRAHAVHTTSAVAATRHAWHPTSARERPGHRQGSRAVALTWRLAADLPARVAGRFTGLGVNHVDPQIVMGARTQAKPARGLLTTVRAAAVLGVHERTLRRT